MSDQPTTPLDRRAALRRAGLLGANLAWSVPAVQALGRAAAAEASGGGGTDPGGGGGGPTTTTVSRSATFVYTVSNQRFGAPSDDTGDPSVALPSLSFVATNGDAGQQGGSITASGGSVSISRATSRVRPVTPPGAAAVAGPDGTGTGASRTFGDPGTSGPLDLVDNEYVSMTVTVVASEQRTV